MTQQDKQDLEQVVGLLQAVAQRHEKADHHGSHCFAQRAVLLALAAHGLGLKPEAVGTVKRALKDFCQDCFRRGCGLHHQHQHN